VIHYWGKLNLKYQRLGEIYNAIRLGLYNYHISGKENLSEFVQKKLKIGTEMLSGRQLLPLDEDLFSEIFSIYKKEMKERQFIYLTLIRLISFLQ
jgi:hypothetical protein